MSAKKIKICLNALLVVQLVVLTFSTVVLADCAANGKARVRSISLIDPNTDRPLPGFAPIRSGSVFDLATLPGGPLLMRANVKRKDRCAVKSIKFQVLNTSYPGNTNSNQAEVMSSKRGSHKSVLWSPAQGYYSIKATPHSKGNGRGRAGKFLRLNLYVIDSAAKAPWTPESPVDDDTLPPGYHCSAGPDMAITSYSSRATLKATCNLPELSSLQWTQLSGPNQATISSTNELNPQVSNLIAGVYIFELTANYSGENFKNRLQLAVSTVRSNFDFTMSVSGPTRVVAGYPLFLDLKLNQTAGSRDFVYVAVDGLPQNTESTEPSWQETCCGGSQGELYGWDLRDTLLKIQTTTKTPPGEYNLNISVVSGGVTRTAQKTLIVEDFPDPIVPLAISSAPAIPRLAEWQANMKKFGRKWCLDPNQQTLWEGNVWYYDGIRIFYQLADYTGDSFYRDVCVPNFLPLYRNFVLNAEPGVQGWRVFPHGLYENFLRTGSSASQQAVFKLADNSVWSGTGGGVDATLSRETAYLIHAYLYKQALGGGFHHNLERTVAMALGHLDQVAVSKTATVIKPFMLGLTFEALIHYYEQSGDPRIPALIKKSADWLWYESGLWDAGSQSFLYINKQIPNDDPATPAPDLNLLIAPVYGWLYHMTGQSDYQDIGDRIFAGGIPVDPDGDGYYTGGSCLACTGKIFSQNYRWSIDYVNWRQNPPH